MSVSVAISGRQVEVAGEAVTIGSGPSNAIAFPGDLRVRSRHAVIRRDEGQWIVEALEAVGVHVNSGPASIRHALRPGDVIRLSPAGPEIVFQPPPPEPANPPESLRPVLPTLPTGPIEELDAFKSPKRSTLAPAPARTGLPTLSMQIPAPQPPVAVQESAESVRPVVNSPPTRSRLGLWVGLGLTLAAIAVAAILLNQPPSQTVVEEGSSSHLVAGQHRDDSAGPESKSAGSKPQPDEPTPVFPEPKDPDPNRPSILPDFPKADPQAPEKGQEPVARVIVDPETIDGSLYAVLLRHEGEHKTYRLGTACAISPRQLATSAGIVETAERLRKEAGLKVILRGLKSEAELPVVHLLAHREYQRVGRNFEICLGQVERLEDEIGRIGERGSVSLIEKLSEQEKFLAEAGREQLWYDVGLLSVSDDLPAHLSLSKFVPRSGSDVRLLGLPFAESELAAVPPVRAEVLSKSSLLDGEAPGSAAWRIELPDAAPLNWSGSPLLDESGMLVGVYSRVTGSGHHAVTDAGRLAELLTVKP